MMNAVTMVTVSWTRPALTFSPEWRLFGNSFRINWMVRSQLAEGFCVIGVRANQLRSFFFVRFRSL